jgi:hypothetical protein
MDELFGRPCRLVEVGEGHMSATLQEIRANRDLMTSVLLTEIQTIVAPLGRLDERTRASIMMLVALAELVAANDRPGADDSIAAEFDRSLVPMHGDGAKLLAQLRTARQHGSSEPAEGPLDALMDVLRCLGLPAPVPYERRRKVRKLTDLPPCLCDPATRTTETRVA